MVRMDPCIDRKFLYLVMVVLCLHTTMYVSQVDSKSTKVKTRITVATLLQPPLVMKDPKTGKYSGLMIDVLNAIGFEVGAVTTMDDRTYGLEKVPQKLGDVVDEVRKGKADVAISLNLNKMTNATGISPGLTYSIPVYHEGFVPLFQPPGKWTQNYSAMLTLLEPFSPGLWCLIIAFCLLTSGVLYILRYLSPFEASKRDKPVPTKSNLMYTIGSLLGRDHREAPRSLSGRVLMLVWWIFSLMTAAAYVAGLVSIIYRMNPRINTLPFATFDELVRQDDVKVLVVKDGLTSDYFRFRKGPVWERFKDQMDSLLVDSVDAGLKMISESDGEYAFLLQGTTAKYLLNQEPCNRMQVTTPYGPIFYNFGCRAGETLCDELDHGILHLQGTGRIDKLQEKYYKGICHQREQFSYEGNPFVDTFSAGDPTWLSPMTLTIKRFGSAFILLAAGFGTTILVLIAEVIYVKWKGSHFFAPSRQGTDMAPRINHVELTAQRDS